MTKIILKTAKAETSRDGMGFSMMLTALMGEGPIPARTVEVKNAAEAATAFDGLCTEAAAAGGGMLVSMALARGERAPPGFRKLPTTRFVKETTKETA